MDIVQEDNEQTSFQFDSPKNVMTPTITVEPHISKLSEVESIDLEDIKFDEEEESDGDAPVLYDRKVVVTKRTIRGSRFREDLSIAALMDDNEYGNGSDSDNDNA